jgi:anti-anti-sigma regulatory factor
VDEYFTYMRRELQSQIQVFELEGKLDAKSQKTFLQVSDWLKVSNVKSILFDFHKIKEINGAGFIFLLALFSRKEHRNKKIILYGLAEPYEILFYTVFQHPSNVEVLKTEAEAIRVLL